MARPLTLVAIACALAAGCGDGGGGGKAGSGPLDFQFFGDAEEVRLYQQVAAAYERATGARVRVTGIGDRKDYLAKLTSSFAARRPPDVFLLNHRNMAVFAERGSLEPVAARLRNADDYYALPREAFTVDGQLQCVPQNASSLVVYLNLDLFESAGLGGPPADWNLAQFMEIAEKLTRGDVHGVGVEPGVIRVAPFVWGAGGELVDDTESPTRFAFDAGEGRAGLDALLAMARFGPSAKEAESKSLEERFLAGELAMFLSSRREVPTFRTIDAFDWDVAPLPVIAAPSTVLHSDGFCMAKAGDVQAAWRFVEFATGPEGQSILARGGRTVPSLKSVATSEAFLDPAQPPASSQVFLDSIEVMRRLPTTANWIAVEDAANLALEGAFYGRMSADEALRRIHAETDGKF